MSLAFGFALPHWQAISGGFGAKMNRMVSTNDEAGVTSIECKVPAGYTEDDAPKDSLFGLTAARTEKL